MLVFGGGLAGSAAANDAFLYEPGTDTWSPAAAPPLGARLYHSAVWTGTELIVWGGYSPDINISGVNAVSDGARYNPSTDTWTMLPPVSSSMSRYLHAAVWSGAEMLIFGGFGPENTPINTGLRFRPSEGVWKTMSTLDAPDPRGIPGALWSGSELLIWGGSSSGGATLGTGARYSPGADEWTPLTTTNAPGARTTHTALWTGTRMLVFGGSNGTTALNDVSLLIPGRTLFIYQQP
jgi:N-acetylneuraminic acid mutarotase